MTVSSILSGKESDRLVNFQMGQHRGRKGGQLCQVLEGRGLHAAVALRHGERTALRGERVLKVIEQLL
jgi:hypothetical protein